MFRLIATIDRQRGLAKQGVQPWFIPEDTQHFDAQTKSLGGTVLMGDVTFKLLGGKPLPDRHNYVLTRDKTPLDGVELVPDLERFLDHWKGQDVWIVGGANVFTQVMQLKRADELYLTHIQADFGCNQFFPDYEDRYALAEQSEMHEQNGFIFTFARYVPRS
jgi:dihydrofolate reductase